MVNMTPDPIPTISVVIPMHNAAPFIAEAVRSVLQQTLEIAELIVVDDGSTDGSAECVPRDPRVRLLSKPHTHIGDTVNHGVRAASGEFIGFLDADDRWLPHKLERQLEVLRAPAESRPDMVFSLARKIYENGGAAVATTDGDNDVVVGASRSGLLLRRATFLQIGYFPPEPEAHEFLDWFSRGQELNLRSESLPEVLWERRIHGANHGVLHREDQRQTYFVTLKKILDRRRNFAEAARNSPGPTSS